jgi:YidC/Oxa1 family membrane protein insertase
MQSLEPPVEEETPQDQVVPEEVLQSESTLDISSPVQQSDSIKALVTQSQYGVFAPSALGTEETTTIENEKIKLTFSNKGGKIVRAELKEHLKIRKNSEGIEETSQVTLLDNERNKFEYLLNLNDKTISTEDLYFTVERNGNQIQFTANTSSGGSFQQIYSLGDGYDMSYDIKFNNLQNDLNRAQPYVTMNWINILNAIEQNEVWPSRYSSVYFKELDDDSDYCNCMGDDIIEEPQMKIEWISHVHQYFNTSILSGEAPFLGGTFSTEMLDNPDELKIASSIVNVPYNHGSSESVAMTMYVGPNDYENLDAYEVGLETIIPYGRSIFGDINRVVIRPSFNFLSKFISSKGLVIIVLIFIIKMLLYPLYYKMLHSQAKMGVLKPELAHLKTKFKDDAQKIQMETMKVYREYGVNPMGGCLPMIIQIPIWYALFRFFPASITFRQESFLWANDLSSYDAFISLPFSIPMFGAHLSLFTILWAISQVVYTYYNMKHMDMSANPAMKYVQYLMPLMFFVYFNTYASGLTCYMFFSQLMNILQTVITKKYVFDDEKIKAELDLNKAKPKKKGKFQQRLEEAMKQQQIQQNKKNSKKK